MRRTFFAILFFCTALPAAALSAPGKALSRAEAVADIDTLVAVVSGVHPGMFFVCPEETFNAAVSAMKAELPDSMDSREFYLRIGRLLPMLGDGHTRMRVPSPDKTAPVFFPWRVTIEAGDSTVTTADGRRIFSVDGIPARQIVGSMLPYMSGESLHFNVMGVQMNFSELFTLLYPADEWMVEWGDEEMTMREKFPAVVFDSIRGAQTQILRKEPYRYRIIDGRSIAVMEFNAFSDRERFGKFAETMFAELHEKGIKNLVIDLRANGGGDSNVGDMLLQYISPVAFAQFGGGAVRFSPRVRAAKPDITEPDGYETFMDVPLVELEDNPLRYAGLGNVYLLTSHMTFSSASSFAWAFQYFNMGTLVGEQTGGMNICFGDILQFRLPNSGFRYSVSWKKFYLYGARDGDAIHGALPDIEIPAARALDYTLDNLIR